MAEILLDRLALVVGVTGHRDIAADDEQPLRAAFRGILNHLAQTCPHTPLLVFSGLAAGADSLAAEEAMASDIPVVACLPMPQDEYEKDFSPSELVRFRSLLGRCSRVIVTSPVRANGYVAAGRFITKYSHLLVAFWDGEPSRGGGGTADVIAMRETGQEGPSDIEAIPSFPDVGPVYVVATPHIRCPNLAEPYRVTRHHEDPSDALTFDSILAHMDTYNVDLAQVPATLDDPCLQALMHRTDQAANQLQQQTVRFQLVLFVIAFLAAAVQIIGHIPLVAKVLGLAAAFTAYWIARKHDYENRYQDYRAIAEALRVQSAWQDAGLQQQLVDKAYLRMQEGELQWIRMALRFFYFLCCEGTEQFDGTRSRSTWEDWVDSQVKYYDTARRREMGLQLLLDRTAVIAILAGVACFIGSAIALGASLPCALGLACSKGFVPTRADDVLQNLLTVPIALAAVLSAIVTHYAEKQNLGANARRYERMSQVFARAQRKLAAIAKGEPENPQEVVYELGCAALIEHADWLIMRRDRPMKVVIA